MNELTIPIHKFRHFLDYLERIDVDSSKVAAEANLSSSHLYELPDDAELPAVHYGRLYKMGIKEIQKLNLPIPWAAGVGSEAFELMCHCMIGARTLGAALELASRFEQLTYPLLSHNMRLWTEGEEAVISYKVNVEASRGLIPEDWERVSHPQTLSNASGLVVWHALCGWLIGEKINAKVVNVAGPYLNEAYAKSLRDLFEADIAFDASENTLRFDLEALDRRVLHNAQSLTQFLENTIFQFLLAERQSASTSAAIRTLIANDLPTTLPSFQTVAQYLHMSESSVRRRLQNESTTYQQLKDEVRCQIAVEMLSSDEIPVTELADYLGFKEPSSFIRSFRSWMGETPSAFREKMALLSA